MIPYRISQWAPGEMMPVYMTCLTCGGPICPSAIQPSRTKYQAWTHVDAHLHIALPAPSLIAELVELFVRPERTEES